MILRACRLDATLFAPFGDVLEQRPGDPARKNFAADLFSDRPEARPNLRIQRTAPTDLPLEAKVIERHRRSSQMFAPMSGCPYLVVVFPSDEAGQPLLERGAAFIAGPGQAVNYAADTWHHPFVALGEGGVFLMLRWEDGTEGDEEFFHLPEPIHIVV
jgi:ureidoglycolate lyase